MKKLITVITLVLCATIVRAENTGITTSQTYVETKVAEKQGAAPANNANSVMTYDSTSDDGIGAKAIYDATASYADQKNALMTAGTANAAIQNAIDNEFTCANPPKCTLWNMAGIFQQDNPTPHSASKNLFNKDDRVHIYGWFPSSGSDWTWAPRVYSNRIPCKPDTTYTARYNGNSTTQPVLSLASTQYDNIPTESHPIVPVTNGIKYTSPTKETPVTITTGPNDKWLIVQYTILEPNNTDMANNLQIEEGATATAYEPYQNLYIPQNMQ